MATEKGIQKLVYRGRVIEIGPKRLLIDGEEIHFEETEDYVYSHEFAYAHLGSSEELAEELIRQWGAAKIQRGDGGGHGGTHGH